MKSNKRGIPKLKEEGPHLGTIKKIGDNHRSN